MIKKIAVFLTLVVLGVGLAGVVSAQTVRGEGRYTEQTLTHLTPFHAIDVRGDAQVDVWQKDNRGVMVSGKSNLVALADIRVEDKTLIVDFKRPVHIKGAHALHVTVMVPQLQAITVHGSGRVRLRGGFDMPQLAVMAADKANVAGDSVKVGQLRVQAMGQAEADLERVQAKEVEAAAFDKAEVELSGSAETAKLTNNGRGDMDAADLRVGQAQVVVNGKGDVEVFATQALQAHANGGGKIEYHGQPELTRAGDMKKIRHAFDD